MLNSARAVASSGRVSRRSAAPLLLGFAEQAHQHSCRAHYHGRARPRAHGRLGLPLGRDGPRNAHDGLPVCACRISTDMGDGALGPRILRRPVRRTRPRPTAARNLESRPGPHDAPRSRAFRSPAWPLARPLHLEELHRKRKGPGMCRAPFCFVPTLCGQSQRRPLLYSSSVAASALAS